MGNVFVGHILFSVFLALSVIFFAMGPVFRIIPSSLNSHTREGETEC